VLHFFPRPLAKHAAARRSERNDTGKDEEFDHVFHSSIINTISKPIQTTPTGQAPSLLFLWVGLERGASLINIRDTS